MHQCRTKTLLAVIGYLQIKKGTVTTCNICGQLWKCTYRDVKNDVAHWQPLSVLETFWYNFKVKRANKWVERLKREWIP